MSSRLPVWTSNALPNLPPKRPFGATIHHLRPDKLPRMPEERFDKTDRAILTVLQQEGRIPNVELAERVALSPSSCLRRTKALESAGLIAGYRAELDPQRLGLGLTMFISLRVDQHSRAMSRRASRTRSPPSPRWSPATSSA